MVFRPLAGCRPWLQAAPLGLRELLVPPFKWLFIITTLDVFEATTDASAQSPVSEVNSVVDTYLYTGGDAMEPQSDVLPWEAPPHHQNKVCRLVQQLAGPLFRVLPWDLDPVVQPAVVSTTPSRRSPLLLSALPPRRVFLAESTHFPGRGCVVKLLPPSRNRMGRGGADVISSATDPSAPDTPAHTPRWSPHCPAKEPAVSAEVDTLLRLRTPVSQWQDHHEMRRQGEFGVHPNIVTLLGVVAAEERVCCCQYASCSEVRVAPASMGSRATLSKCSAPARASPHQVRAVLLEYVSGGAWCDFLDTYGAFVTPLCVMRWFMDVVAGLAYLHRHGVVHGNLTPANILVRLIAVGPRGVFEAASNPAQEYDSVRPLLEFLVPEAGVADATGANGPAVQSQELIVSALLEKTQLVLSGFRCAKWINSDDGLCSVAHAGEVRTGQPQEYHEDAADVRSAAADLWNAALAFYLLLIGGANAVARGRDAVATREAGAEVAGTQAHFPDGAAAPLLRLAGMTLPQEMSPGPAQRAGGRGEHASEAEPRPASQTAAQMRPLWAALPVRFLELLDKILHSHGDPTQMPTAAEAALLMDQIMASPLTLQRCNVHLVPQPAWLLEQLLNHLQSSSDDAFVCRPMACMPLGRALEDADTCMLSLRFSSDASDASPRWLLLNTWRTRLLELERILLQPAEVLAEWAAVDDGVLLLVHALMWMSQHRFGTRQRALQRADAVALLVTVVRSALAEVPSAHGEQRGRRSGPSAGFGYSFRLGVAQCIALGQPLQPLSYLISPAIMTVFLHFQRTPSERWTRHWHGFMRR
ncbi:hypothetical protein LSCM1_06310 [Leishmania martiniquensis]|uniref:Protein kinase domain-containing protein n=1 Tax=Leishmania martiniquensis TaxID=1580590 RepID=A0A836KN81_9TRYP|nr:hypothetical protein LSCM1_06310 [Leishmania martiniquensis]